MLVRPACRRGSRRSQHAVQSQLAQKAADHRSKSSSQQAARAILASVVGTLGCHLKYIRCCDNMKSTIRGQLKATAAVPQKYVLRVRKCGDAGYPILPSNIDLARQGGERKPFCPRRCSSSRSPYKTGAGTCCSPTTRLYHRTGIPPSQAIAEGTIAKTAVALEDWTACSYPGAFHEVLLVRGCQRSRRLPGPGSVLQRTDQWLRGLPGNGGVVVRTTFVCSAFEGALWY